MNANNTNISSWDSSLRRSWCNGGFRQALNPTIRNIFKKFICITGYYNGQASGGSNRTTQDYFALAAGKEVFGGGSSISYSTDNEADALTWFTYYHTEANRIKKHGDSGQAYYWWERSTYYTNSRYFCFIYGNGTTNGNYASITFGISPFGCV